MGKDKKGLSKIVSTALLLVLSLAAVGFLYGVVFSLVEDTRILEEQKNLNCINSVEIQILGACHEGNLLKVAVKNRRELILGDFFLALLTYKDGTVETIPTSYNTHIGPYETKTIILAYDKEIEKIKIIPRIEDQSFLCLNAAPETENIKSCA